MNRKGFTFIELIVSIVLISAVLYGVSIVPIELSRLKGGMMDGFQTDKDILTLKQNIDGEIADGGIYLNSGTLYIGEDPYLLTSIGGGKYTFTLNGVSGKVVYYQSGDGSSFFYVEENPNLELRYRDKLTSFGVVR